MRAKFQTVKISDFGFINCISFGLLRYSINMKFYSGHERTVIFHNKNMDLSVLLLNQSNVNLICSNMQIWPILESCITISLSQYENLNVNLISPKM